MFSCDTMVVCAPYSHYGQNVFAKNSDRPTGEPQPPFEVRKYLQAKGGGRVLQIE